MSPKETGLLFLLGGIACFLSLFFDIFRKYGALNDETVTSYFVNLTLKQRQTIHLISMIGFMMISIALVII